jgi:hypothetical protein
MSCRQAAKLYGLPLSTLNDKVNERNSDFWGCPTFIDRNEEEIIVNLISYMNEIGFDLYIQEVIQVVFNYLKIKKQTNLFKNGYPGKEWVSGFRKRHNLPSYADALNEKSEIMDAWLEKIEKIYQSNDFHMKPTNIFKCEEVGFGCELGQVEILLRNSVTSNAITNELGPDCKKDLYSILVCSNATGGFLPLNIIYKSKSMRSSWCIDGPDNANYDTSDSGWMEALQFLNWFKNIFLKQTEKLEGWKILFLDGHASHMSSELKELATENKVLLYRVPGRLRAGEERSSIYDTLKTKWIEIIQEELNNRGFKTADKRSFPSIMKIFSEKGLIKMNVINGFEMNGLYPLNRQKIIFKSKKSIPTIIASTATSLKQKKASAQIDVACNDPLPKEAGAQETSNKQLADPNKKRCSCRPTLHLDDNFQKEMLKVVEDIMTKTIKTACLEMTKAIVELVEQKSSSRRLRPKRNLDSILNIAEINSNQLIEQNVNKIRKILQPPALTIEHQQQQPTLNNFPVNNLPQINHNQIQIQNLPQINQNHTQTQNLQIQQQEDYHGCWDSLPF